MLLELSMLGLQKKRENWFRNFLKKKGRKRSFLFLLKKIKSSSYTSVSRGGHLLRGCSGNHVPPAMWLKSNLLEGSTKCLEMNVSIKKNKKDWEGETNQNKSVKVRTCYPGAPRADPSRQVPLVIGCYPLKVVFSKA